MYSELAYLRGVYPPARCSPPFGNCSIGNSDVKPLIATHNMLLSHAKAAKLYRDQYRPKQRGFIGIAANAFMYEPYGDNEYDREAVRRALAFKVAWVLDPLMYGDYPTEMRQYHGKELPNFSREERELVKGSLDFIGVNHYSTLYATDCLHFPCSPESNRPILGYVNFTGERHGVPIGERTGMSEFFVVPQGMEKILDYIKRRYPNMPIFVTENGYSSPAQNDELQDYKRIEYHKAYLAALARAMRKGADVKGYFIWSLMDNFEWVHGYSIRFGLHYVDRRTLRRIPKLSARWYAGFLTNRSHCQSGSLPQNSPAQAMLLKQQISDDHFSSCR
ncbi:hypothetical protein Nepgr_027375 [Nepenthes gracilis]|uniref:Beta-glucosidase n=1 Tax=Nepenthes gracilis TaxID=150966 RepID=A0AAD3TBM5_NEPGR|nr:hypothetical protein Nepgr_027375 [Nepenthes gracilis]